MYHNGRQTMIYQYLVVPLSLFASFSSRRKYFSVCTFACHLLHLSCTRTLKDNLIELSKTITGVYKTRSWWRGSTCSRPRCSCSSSCSLPWSSATSRSACNREERLKRRPRVRVPRTRYRPPPPPLTAFTRRWSWATRRRTRCKLTLRCATGPRSRRSLTSGCSRRSWGWSCRGRRSWRSQSFR